MPVIVRLEQSDALHEAFPKQEQISYDGPFEAVQIQHTDLIDTRTGENIATFNGEVWVDHIGRVFSDIIIGMAG